MTTIGKQWCSCDPLDRRVMPFNICFKCGKEIPAADIPWVGPTLAVNPPMPEVQVKLLRSSAKMPTYMSEGAAACDVYADIDEPIVFYKHGRSIVVPLGFALAIPRGWCARIVGRSGLSRDGLVCRSGLIDSDYRGCVGAILSATSDRHDAERGVRWHRVEPGDRIAQMYFTLAPRATLRSVTELPATARGEGGFGSTGPR